MSRQSAFRAAILDADRPAPPDLQDGLGRPAKRRFNVYRNNVAVSLTEALEAGFPAVARLLGEENSVRLRAVTCVNPRPIAP